MNRKEEIKNLIANRTRRLQKLKEIQARQGVTTDPSVILEIEDQEVGIRKLQAELKVLEEDVTYGRLDTVRVQLQEHRNNLIKMEQQFAKNVDDIPAEVIDILKTERKKIADLEAQVEHLQDQMLSDEVKNNYPPSLAQSSKEGSKFRITRGGVAKFFETLNIAAERLSRAEPKDVQKIVASQIEMLSAYYSLVHDQADRSFRLAVIFALTGIIIFIAATVFLFVYQMENIATVSIIAGAIVEIISAIGFYLYGKTSMQFTKFHERLILTQRFVLANSLCENLEGEIKDQARFEVIKKIAGVNDSAENSNEIMGTEEK